LCDVILSFDDNAKTVSVEDLKEAWEGVFKKHKGRQKAWGDTFLDTLITCDYYLLSAGIIVEMKPGEPGEILKVKENPECPVPLKMNTWGRYSNRGF